MEGSSVLSGSLDTCYGSGNLPFVWFFVGYEGLDVVGVTVSSTSILGYVSVRGSWRFLGTFHQKHSTD